MMSPSRRAAMGPPAAASGATWQTAAPRLAPEKRPSVMRAFCSLRNVNSQFLKHRTSRSANAEVFPDSHNDKLVEPADREFAIPKMDGNFHEFHAFPPPHPFDSRNTLSEGRGVDDYLKSGSPEEPNNCSHDRFERVSHFSCSIS